MAIDAGWSRFVIMVERIMTAVPIINDVGNANIQTVTRDDKAAAAAALVYRYTLQNHFSSSPRR
eukprot:scaffold224316_cov18-Prasinocladus_malaysianus.AAC.1